jgi:phage terminase Nu1 subunit (DNA packaging protein)
MAKAPRPDLHSLMQSEIATLLGLSTRQVRNLVDQGAPGTTSKDGKITFDGPIFSQWYWERKISDAVEKASPPDEWDATARRNTAQARMIEFDLAEREKKLVNTDLIADQWGKVLGLIDDLFDSIEGRALRFVGLRTPNEAKVQLRDLRNDLKSSAAAIGGHPSLDKQEAA